MSKIVSVKQIFDNKVAVGDEITLRGWVRSRRDSKAGISFLAISDGSCFDPFQAVIPSSLENYKSEILKLTKDCSVIVKGILIESQGKGQTTELETTSVEVIGWVEDPETYPISPKRHTVEYLREYSHLRVRTNLFGALTRVRHCVAQAIHRFFHEEGFFWVNTPVITSNDCEGAGELFRVSTLDLANLPRNDKGQVDFKQDFFGKEVYLTVSGQLNAEGYCSAMSNVYTFGPTFRAENSNTSRHLAEFWMIEPEIAFATLKDDILLAEKLLKYVIAALLNERGDDMAFFNKWVDKTTLERLQNILNNHIEILEYTDAVEMLEKANVKFEYPVKWGIDLQTEHERYLVEKVFNKPVAVINYPKIIKPFYMRVNDDDKTVAAMDVLVPGIGEIIGGSQREERIDVLDARIQELGLVPEDYDWYRDLRRYGTVPHAGFGLGFERLLGYLTGVSNVRDLIPYPRTPGNAIL